MKPLSKLPTVFAPSDFQNNEENSDRVKDRPPLTKSIADVAEEYGVSLRTLRFYEELGLLSPMRLGGSRFYCPEDEVRLQVIAKGKRFGFSLAEIHRMIFQRSDRLCGNLPFEKGVEADVLGTLTKKEIEDRIASLTEKRSRVLAALSELRIALKNIDI